MNNEYTSPLETVATTEEYEELTNKCPGCGNELEQIQLPNYPEDCYIAGLYCDNCKYCLEF